MALAGAVLACARPGAARASTAANSLSMLGPIGHGFRSPTATGDSLRPSRCGIDYLWVLRTALLTPQSVDSVVARAARMGVRGLLVQVVGRGDAFYRSDVLPPAEILAEDNTLDTFDPLARTIERAHAAGLEVHAWMNCMLVWSAPHAPRDKRHVVIAHPEWVAGLKDGLRMNRLSDRSLRRLRVEGVYLAPANPNVRAWLVSVAAEIASRYDIDGLHLDYIRQPDVKIGGDPTTRARFAYETGVDPAYFQALSHVQRGEMEARWRQFQRDQITAAVRAIHDTLRALRPELSLSAAVVADTSRSNGPCAQAWRDWLRDGLVDRVYPMCYSPDVQTVMDQLVSFDQELGADERIVPGIAVYNTPAATAAVKIKGARALGFPLLALYSYDSLFADALRWVQLEHWLVSADAVDR
jgi:uncharacterized lipoprotein YddW (UPF0748 family)